MVEADLAVENRPQDAQAWFIRGAIYLAEGGDDSPRQEIGLESLERTLELDPNFEGPDGTSAAEIAQETLRLRAAMER